MGEIEAVEFFPSLGHDMVMVAGRGQRCPRLILEVTWSWNHLGRFGSGSGGGAGVRVWQTTWRARGPRTGRSSPEGC